MPLKKLWNFNMKLLRMLNKKKGEYIIKTEVFCWDQTETFQLYTFTVVIWLYRDFKIWCTDKMKQERSSIAPKMKLLFFPVKPDHVLHGLTTYLPPALFKWCCSEHSILHCHTMTQYFHLIWFHAQTDFATFPYIFKCTWKYLLLVRLLNSMQKTQDTTV